MTYEALSPWGQSDSTVPVGLSPRLETLEGKRIGLYSHFKTNAVVILQEVAEQLGKRFPGASFHHFQYVRDTSEIKGDAAHHEAFQSWLENVDAVICAYGDAGSCSMYLAYNAAYIEKLGKPVLVLCEDVYLSSTRRGAAARGVPNMRICPIHMTPVRGLRLEDTIDSEALRRDNMRQPIAGVLDDIVKRMLDPLTEEERHPTRSKDYAGMKIRGSLREINDQFYRYGWSSGVPIIPPTEEAVNEMLSGTDLPRDYVVGVIPPMMGKATVEKIAINAVMAGCLPTYMPILIAAVRGMLDPKIFIEGWTCSNHNWTPLEIVSGPAAEDIHLYSDAAVLSPYFKPNATIPRAIAYITMNIGGVRVALEDMSRMGTPSRFGVCFADNTRENPWGPFHTDYGFRAEDSVLTMFWPSAHNLLLQDAKESAKTLVRAMCSVRCKGWANGAAFIVSPEMAAKLAADGWGRQQLLDYVVEYNRIPSEELDLGWYFGNNHQIPGAIPPIENTGYSTRTFWNKDHMFLAVAGRSWAVAFTGGGDHGGPAHTKIELPANWKELVSRYDDVVPDYIPY